MSVRFDQTKSVIDLYIQSSDSFIKLALAILAASVAFPTKDWPPTLLPLGFLFVAWIVLMISVAAGCLYQYVAIHFLDSHSDEPHAPGAFPRLERNPGIVYGTMMITFYLGAVLALVGICLRL